MQTDDLQAELLRSGSVFVSSTFGVPELTPHEALHVNDLHRSSLLVLRM
ncbi:MAG: hypothetical protein ABI479_03170 [Gallionella sp.]